MEDGIPAQDPAEIIAELQAQIRALETQVTELTDWSGKEVSAARDRAARMAAENLVWRQLMAEFRELIVPFSQSFPIGKPYARIRLCMAHPAAMNAEVEKVLAEQRRAAESASVVSP